MDIIFSVIPEQLFWRIMLFIHFLVAVTLMTAITLQVVAVLMPARQVAGNFVDRGPVPAPSYAAIVVPLYVIQVLLGAFIYLKYRLYVRIPMEELRHWWTLGGFEFKEHILAMGLGLLPAYWYFWQQPQSTEHAVVRKWLTVFLAVSVWYGFVSGHIANDFRGIGS
jgi:hypothetical protein